MTSSANTTGSLCIEMALWPGEKRMSDAKLKTRQRRVPRQWQSSCCKRDSYPEPDRILVLELLYYPATGCDGIGASQSTTLTLP
jgi:hypothetical protein